MRQNVNVVWGLSPIFPLSLAAGEGRLRRASRRREQVVMPQRLPPDAEREGVRKMALTVSHRPYHKGLTLAAPNSLAEVRRFADDHDLSPGIVVGRYRHITQRFNAFGNSISRFTWSEGMWRVA